MGPQRRLLVLTEPQGAQRVTFSHFHDLEKKRYLATQALHQMRELLCKYCRDGSREMLKNILDFLVRFNGWPHSFRILVVGFL